MEFLLFLTHRIISFCNKDRLPFGTLAAFLNNSTSAYNSVIHNRAYDANYFYCEAQKRLINSNMDGIIDGFDIHSNLKVAESNSYMFLSYNPIQSILSLPIIGLFCH